MIRVYLRCSADTQDLDSQRHACEQWLRAYGHSEAVKWYDRDQGISGDAKNRPDHARLIKDAKRGDTVLCFALDRLSREGIVPVLKTWQEFQSKGVRLVSVSEPWADSGNPAAEVVIAVLAWAGQQEKKRIKERQKAGIAAAKAAGKSWGGSKKGTFKARTPELDALVRKLKHEDKKSVCGISRLCKISRPTVYAILKGDN